MLHFKSCPRCKGDVYENNDHYGDYHECLQCGYTRDLDTHRKMRTSGDSERREVLAAAEAA